MRVIKLTIISILLLLLTTSCSNKKTPEKSFDNDISPTPMSGTQMIEGSNTSESSEDLKPSILTFSRDSGMYADAFELTISATNGETIYYTLDGSDPSQSITRLEYNAPLLIQDRSGDPNVLASLDHTQFTTWYGQDDMKSKNPIDKCTIIRATTDGCITDTKTYFVGKNSTTYNNIPILSLVTDSSNLFDYEKGIYVLGKIFDDYKEKNPGYQMESWGPANYNLRGREWERPVHIDFFESDGTIALSQDCGVRIQGNYSRGDIPKSLRFYARKDYGSGSFGYNFLGDRTGETQKPTTKDTFVLRTGANDSYYTKFKDSYLQSLVEDRKVETQAGRACILFIDGEYWGLYTLQEDYSNHYFENKYGVDKDQVIYYKNNELDEGKESDLAFYTDLINFAKHKDLTEEENYKTIGTMLDLDSFIDYMSIEMFLINEDWPGHNTGLWKTRVVDPNIAVADGRWRFTLYDTEMGAYHYGNASTRPDANNLELILENEDDPGILFQALIKNEEFKKQFVTVFMDLANVNFEVHNTLTKMQPYIDTYYPEMGRFFERFQTWSNYENATDECINRMKLFFNGRSEYVPTMLKEVLELQGEAVDVVVTLNDSSAGAIMVNTTTPDLSSGTWKGKYFTDYPITLTAISKEGYTFAGWSGTESSMETTITVSFQEAITLHAEFMKD